MADYSATDTNVADEVDSSVPIEEATDLTNTGIVLG